MFFLKKTVLKSEKLIHILLVAILLTLILVGCANSDIEVSSGSCASLELSTLESAVYDFTMNGTTERLGISVNAVNEKSIHISYTENGQNHNVVIAKSCGELLSGILTSKVRYILYGDQWIGTPYDGTTSSADVLVPIDWDVQCDSFSQLLEVAAGSYSVRKCILTPKNNASSIKRIIRYTKVADDGIQSQPFSGVIQQVVELKDGSVANVQLMQWNSL